MLLRLLVNATIFVFYISCFSVFLAAFNCNWFMTGQEEMLVTSGNTTALEMVDLRFRMHRFPEIGACVAHTVRAWFAWIAESCGHRVLWCKRIACVALRFCMHRCPGTGGHTARLAGWLHAPPSAHWATFESAVSLRGLMAQGHVKQGHVKRAWIAPYVGQGLLGAALAEKCVPAGRLRTCWAVVSFGNVVHLPGGFARLLGCRVPAALSCTCREVARLLGHEGILAAGVWA